MLFCQAGTTVIIHCIVHKNEQPTFSHLDAEKLKKLLNRSAVNYWRCFSAKVHVGSVPCTEKLCVCVCVCVYTHWRKTEKHCFPSRQQWFPTAVVSLVSKTVICHIVFHRILVPLVLIGVPDKKVSMAQSIGNCSILLSCPSMNHFFH
jgi:hypothetical protein